MPFINKGGVFINIINQATATSEQAIKWAKDKKATDIFISNANIYWNIAKDHGGVNPVVAYVQYAKETGYGKFGGVLDESYCNPCGLKTPKGGDCKDPDAHTRFASWEEGIKAQLDHLALYAGAEGYPRKDTTDPRHFPYLIGKCKTVESLSDNWTGQGYGEDLVTMCNELIKTEIKNNEILGGKVMKIGLRGGHSPNCKGAMGLRDEQECMRALYNHVAGLLRKHGHTVIDCNSNASSNRVEMQEGANKANSNNVDYFISLHMNASNGQGHGTEAWIYNNNSRAKHIAERLVDNFKKLGFRNRGVKGMQENNKKYFEMHNISAPNIIFETLFCDNKNDIGIWANTSWETFSYAIANAIDTNIPRQPEQPKPEPPSSNSSNNTKLRVVVGTYKDKSNATSMQNKLKGKGFDSFLVAHEGMYRVVAGTYGERNNAVNMQNKLKNAGFDSFLAVYNG